MSLWAWTLSPQLAVPLAVFGALLGQILAAFSIRREIDGALLRPFIYGGLCGIPLGLWLLPHLNSEYFKLFLGGFLTLCCPAMLLARDFPKLPFGGRLMNGIIGAIGGATGAIGGFSGTIPTLWCSLQKYDRHVQRAVIQNFNLAMLSVTMVMYLVAGLVTVDMLPHFGVAFPCIAVSAFLGIRLYSRINDRLFRMVILLLLTASGLALLASGAASV